MDSTAHRRRVHQPIISDEFDNQYQHDLSMFAEFPSNTINLSEFEDIAVERLQLLRILEQAGVKGHKLYSDDWRQCIKEDLTKASLKKYVRLMSGFSSNTEVDYQARRSDHISHFILRLAYCRSEELRRWFLSRELEWFRVKFSAQSHDNIKHFLKINNLTQYTPISNQEKEAIIEELRCSTAGLSAYSCEANDFYKVPFIEVCSLVKNRKVFLKGGMAYVPTSELVICLQSAFRTQLSESLNVFYRRLPFFDDDRVNRLLENLHHVYTGNTYAVREDKDSVDPSNLDLYSKKHYPLCMRHMHEILRSEHHLKHDCRLQYGLFLKAIGLLFEDAMKFWREEFTKKIDGDKFDKSYTYNIKHQYGKVGRMMNYSPYSCIKIILGSVGAGDHHGCPFKHWDPSNIKQKIIEYGISSEHAEEIKELVTNGHYQVACSKYFEYSHGKAPPNGINHPNQYFEESMNLEKENSGNKKN